MIGVAELKDGLYALRLDNPKRIPTVSLDSNAVNFHFSNSRIRDKESELWHSRLGHPSSNKMHILHKIFPFIDSKLENSHCLVCHLATFKRLPYLKSTNVSENYFNLLHVDI